MINNNTVYIASWNSSGWSGPNQSNQERIVEYVRPNILFVLETWTTQENAINIEGYRTFNNNRSFLHKNSYKGSGGQAILVKDSLFKGYTFKCVDDSVNGVPALKMKDKHTDYTAMLFCLYLPPENSIYGLSPDEFFEYLVSVMYEMSNVDQVIMGGDINA